LESPPSLIDFDPVELRFECCPKNQKEEEIFSRLDGDGRKQQSEEQGRQQTDAVNEEQRQTTN
jgi:hypothetical protein